MQDHSIEGLLDSPQKKLAFFQNLVIVATADGVLDGQESKLLVEIGNKLGLTAEEAMPIADNLDVLSFIIPEEGLQKTLELQSLVLMMLQDGKIDDREYGLCVEYTRRIGYGVEILDDMIRQLAQNRSQSQ
jgi:hypothetical protein